MIFVGEKMDYKKLSDLCDVVSGGTPARSRIECWENGTIPWVKISDLSSKYIKGTEEKITETGLKESSAKLLPRGTILFSIFATLGATGILDIDASTNQAIAGLTVRDSRTIDPEYLYYYLLSKKTYVNNIGRGVAQNNINLSILKSLEVPVPTVDEQRSIITILNKNDAIITGKRKVLKALNELVKARFVEMFGNEKNLMPISDICSIITDGTHQPPKFRDTGIPFIFVSNITGDKVTYDAEKFIDQDTYDELIKRTPIEIGDVLLSTVGSYGHPAVVKSNKKFLFQRHIAYLKPRREIIDSDYLHGAILSPDAQRQIEEGVKGIAQKTLNLSEIKKMRIPVPDMNKQKEFATFSAQVDKSKAAVQKSLDETQLLFNSLMQKYFG